MTADPKFIKSHQEWLDKHVRERKGEAKRRLLTGHAHAEKAMLEHVWWKAFGHFDYLHPEYEVRDFLEGRRYFDFAYIRSGLYIAIEVDPFGTHYDKLDRRKYSDQWVRQMHLFNDSWLFVRMSLDDITERPRMWQQLFQQMVGRLFGDAKVSYDLSANERDIIRMGLRLNRDIKLRDVKSLLDCGYETAKKHIDNLEKSKWLLPIGSGSARKHAWRVDLDRKMPPL